MSKLTLERAITDSFQVWVHIGETGDFKADTVKHLVNEEQQAHLEYLDFDNAYCPFCEYAVAESGTSTYSNYCKHCPAAGMWVEGAPGAKCTGESSPYNPNVMTFGSTSDKRKVGEKMIDLVIQAAKKHNVNL